MDESGRLESGYSVNAESGVRIPLSPPFISPGNEWQARLLAPMKLIRSRKGLRIGGIERHISKVLYVSNQKNEFFGVFLCFFNSNYKFFLKDKNYYPLIGIMILRNFIGGFLKVNF